MCGCVCVSECRRTGKTIFMRSLTGLISECSFSQTGCRTHVKEPSLPYHLPIDGGRIIGCIPFVKVTAVKEKYIYI